MIGGYKKRFIHLGIIVIMFSILLGGCVGLLDWSVYLPENYAIIHVNSRSIIFGKLNKHGSSYVEPIGDSFVVAYCYNDKVIGLCCAEDYNKSLSWNSMERKYYLFDFKSGKTIEVHDQYELEAEIKNVTGNDPIVWKLTRPTPDEAVYPDEEKEQ